MKISRRHSVTLLKLNTHNTSSGRFYPDTCFATLPKSVYGMIDASGISADGTINLMMVGFHVTNIRIEHDELLGDIDFINGPSGDYAKAVVQQGFEYRAASMGVVDIFKKVSNANLFAVYLAKDSK